MEQNQLNDLKTFLLENFYTKDELDDKMTKLATKEIVNNLTTAVDGYAKQNIDRNQEQLILGHKTNRMETAIIQIARKVGVKYEA